MPNLELDLKGFMVEETTFPEVSSFSTPDGRFSHQPDSRYLQLHVYERDALSLAKFLRVERINKAFSQIAHYLTMREERSHIQFNGVIGITHDKMARNAVNHFGFTSLHDVDFELFDSAAVMRLERDWNSKPYIVAMDRNSFVKRFKKGKPDGRTEVSALLNSVHFETPDPDPETVRQAIGDFLVERFPTIKGQFTIEDAKFSNELDTFSNNDTASFL